MGTDVPVQLLPGFRSTHPISWPQHGTTALSVREEQSPFMEGLIVCQATIGQGLMVIHPVHKMQQYHRHTVPLPENMI